MFLVFFITIIKQYKIMFNINIYCYYNYNEENIKPISVS